MRNDLADAKKRRGTVPDGLDTPDRVASRLAYSLGDRRVDAIDTLYGELDKVTPDDIMTAAKSFFTPENRTVCCAERNREMKTSTNPCCCRLPCASILTMGEGSVNTDDAVLLPVRKDPTICFRIWFKVGSQNDPKGKEGLAEVTAAISLTLRRGTTPTNKYSTSYTRCGRYDAEASVEMTGLGPRA